MWKGWLLAEIKSGRKRAQLEQGSKLTWSSVIHLGEGPQRVRERLRKQEKAKSLRLHRSLSHKCASNHLPCALGMKQACCR
eukprot:2246853-Pleurochrysis_carterae.AAC.1